MKRRFATLDVFTSQRFAGNPLAVVLESEGLDTATMQVIAREFNYSETVFVLAPEDGAHRARLRIFTPNFEMPFAGHPTIGTAVLLAIADRAGAPGEAHFTLGENVGPIPCRARVESDLLGSAAFDAAVAPARIGEIGPPATLARALGVAAGEIGFAGAAPGLYSAGAAFALVPMASAAAVDAATPSRMDWLPAFGMNDRQSAFLIAPTPEPGVYYARMFAYGREIYEDPATGSASAAAAALLAEAEAPGEGSHRRLIRQGEAMGRPSRIDLTYQVSGGTVSGATIGGSAILVGEGVLHT